jgi:hypothetical protein
MNFVILAGFEGAQDFSLAHSFEAIAVEGLGKTQGRLQNKPTD